MKGRKRRRRIGRGGGRGARGLGAPGGGGDELESLRDEAISVLSECFSRDMLSLHEFERRADLVHGAANRAELGAAIDGIGGAPGTVGGPARAAPGAGVASTGQASKPLRSALDIARERIVGGSARPDERRDLAASGRSGTGHDALAAPAPHAHDRAIAVFGETRREGVWSPARHTQAVAVMGSTVLDFRDVPLPPGRTFVSAVAVMGSVEVIVPLDCHVECAGSAVMGSFEQRREYMPQLGGPDGPVLRIGGVALFGSVEIERRRSGESAREAKKRRKAEKKDMKRLRRGR